MNRFVTCLASNSHTINTRETYRKALDRLSCWLVDHHEQLCDESLAAHLADLYGSGHSQSMCALAVAAAGWYARQSGTASPVGNLTKKTMAGIRRSPRQGSGQVEGLLWEDSDKVAAIQAHAQNAFGWRNAAIISLASDALLRVSELAALEVSDLKLEGEGAGLLLVQRSKTDQEGRGDCLYIGDRSVFYVDKWLQVSGIRTERLFRRLSTAGKVVGHGLTPGSIRQIIKQCIASAGFKGRFSGHSLRIGSAQSLAERDASLVSIMHDGRWKSSAMPARYVAGQLASKSAVARLRYPRG